MMNPTWRIFLVFSILLLQTFPCFGVEEETLRLSRKMIGLIQKAKNCAIRPGKDSVDLCTGITLDKKDLDFFKGLDAKRCQQFIRQMGYQVYQTKDKVTQARVKTDKNFKQMRDEFDQSTKLAYIDYKLKSVLFKPSAQVGDCIHEIIHFYQHNRPSTSELSPAHRDELQEKLQVQLEKEIEIVAGWEKKGNKEKAMEMANQLSPLIQLQKEWIKLTEWLDEKEVYEFMFEYYDDLGLSARDFDIAVSNLVRLQYALDWRWMQKALYHANQLLNHKYSGVQPNLEDLKTEKEYNLLYTTGKISRDEFEAKVIAQRKGMALLDYKRAKKLKDQLSALVRGRFFKEEQKMNFAGQSLSYAIHEDLPYVDLEVSISNGKKFKLPMLIDLGAQQSIIPLSFIEHAFSQYRYPEEEGRLLLVGDKKIQSGHTGSEQVPLVQVNTALELGGEKMENMTFALSSSPFFLKIGILGIDFFQKSGGLWTWDFEKKKLVLSTTQKEKKGKKDEHAKRSLIKNGLGAFDALEFNCPANSSLQVRIDTGSQVYGDFRKDLSQKEVESCIVTTDELSALPPHQIYFSRGVDINLGFLYLNKYYKYMKFNLSEGFLEFERLKEEM